MPLHLSIDKLFSFFLKLFIWLLRLSMAFSLITFFHVLWVPFFIIVYMFFMFCMLLFDFVNYLLLLLCLYILIVVCVLFCLFCFHGVVLCIVCVKMCTVLLPPGVNPIAVNKYIISN